MGLLHDQGVLRGVEAGPYPLEALAAGPQFAPETRLSAHSEPLPEATSELGLAAVRYQNIFASCTTQNSAPRGDGSGDPAVRAREIKGAGYYLDAAGVGICALSPLHWYASPEAGHSHAVVILAAHGAAIEADNLAAGWVSGSQDHIALMRALEIGTSLLGHIRALGFDATVHYPGASTVCLPTLCLSASLCQPHADGPRHPFIGHDFVAVALTTDYAMAVDLPLDPTGRVAARRYRAGINGALSGREIERRKRRPSHLSRYPMETVQRVDQPTTAIFADEIPRVPKRAEFFMRARKGDLGAKAQREVARFAFKHPLTDGMMYPLRAMVPHQDGAVAAQQSPDLADAAQNSRALKSLSYHLGADLTGICELPDYAWYSHGPDGSVIEPRHKYAVVMLIDQGYDTMEGASGDDWISGCQSMRGYIRGAEIAGLMADFIRSQGYPARAQTNADSEVLQIPLVLLAGLGELSRIGELVLNPFVGPRFKSVVLTTNLPLEVDQPIDFGLQTFCGNCLKCARECPVNAIPFGDKVVFNGYEIWKPDVERCTRYRVTNPRGSACGRCMKTCPLNKVVTTDGALLHRMGTWLGIHARWLKPVLVPIAVWLDDKLGYGKRNPVKRWWQDLELIDGVARKPAATNERDLDLSADTSGAKSPVGYYFAADMPAPDNRQAHPANHRAAIERAALVETVAEARQRRKLSAKVPTHYIPVTEIPVTELTSEPE